MLEEQETWKVQDSTKLQTYMECPRKYFFKYVLGWRRVEPNVHLVFGRAVHKAMEYLLAGDGELPHGVRYTPEIVSKAYEIFEDEYRKVFPPEEDEANAPKIPANVFHGLVDYVAKYNNFDHFEVLFTEVSGCVLVQEERELYFKADSICKGEEGIFSLEHKTTSRFNIQWLNQWKQKVQVGTYLHMLTCMFPTEPIKGVVINGLLFRNPPRLKKDGTPYAGAKSSEFERVTVFSKMSSMEAWLYTVNYWLDAVEDDFYNLSQSSDSDSALRCFPKNTQSCSNYFGCPFLDYCHAWDNPLQHLGELPAGFKVEYWDPRSMLKESKTQFVVPTSLE